jgi:predicted acetyltransferase
MKGLRQVKEKRKQEFWRIIEKYSSMWKTDKEESQLNYIFLRQQKN